MRVILPSKKKKFNLKGLSDEESPFFVLGGMVKSAADISPTKRD